MSSGALKRPHLWALETTWGPLSAESKAIEQNGRSSPPVDRASGRPWPTRVHGVRMTRCANRCRARPLPADVHAITGGNANQDARSARYRVNGVTLGETDATWQSVHVRRRSVRSRPSRWCTGWRVDRSSSSCVGYAVCSSSRSVVWGVGLGRRRASTFMQRRVSAHSSCCSASTAPMSRSTDARSGNAPTTSVRRRISLLRRFGGWSTGSAPPRVRSTRAAGPADGPHSGPVMVQGPAGATCSAITCPSAVRKCWMPPYPGVTRIPVVIFGNLLERASSRPVAASRHTTSSAS